MACGPWAGQGVAGSAVRPRLGEREAGVWGKGRGMKRGRKEKMKIGPLSTGSRGLGIALGGGGLPKGRVIES